MNTRTSYTNINIANQWYGTNAYSETHKKLPEEKNYMTLTTNQKQNLRTQAHHLDPIIQIGKNGVTPQQLSQIKKGLEDHELVKIKYIAHKNKKETLSKEISNETNSEQIDLIGNVLILYKKHKNPERRKINPNSK